MTAEQEYKIVERRVIKYSKKIVKELAKKYGVPEPDVTIEKRLTSILRIGGYIPYKGTITINDAIIHLWIKDKDYAIKILKYVIAHEFAHHLQFLRGAIHTRLGSFRPLMEREADQLGEEYSGINEKIVNEGMWWVQLQKWGFIQRPKIIHRM